MIDDTKAAMETKNDVVEKRVTTTIIRRRSQKKPDVLPDKEIAEETSQVIEAVLQPEGGPSKTSQAADAVGEVVSVSDADKSAGDGVEKSVQTVQVVAESETAGIKFNSSVSEEERKIGVVGRINLNAQTPSSAAPAVSQGVREREDWRDRLKKGPKRKKSRAELDMEVIQRAGGLRSYAEVYNEDESAVAAVQQAPVSDRVFQPSPRGKKRKTQRRDFKHTQITERKAIKKVIRMEETIGISDLSQSLGIKAGEIISKLMSLGIMATINSSIDVDTAQLIAEEWGFSVERFGFKEEDVLAIPEAHASGTNFEKRAPVVTVMGHVDHGKTSILDVIRKASVADGEAGGITQHIGAYEVEVKGRKITFIDTPGHEAFTTMRARGAQITDLVILVVAADDGIMPQTIEAIDHSKAAGVPIIIAMNKMDRPEAQPDRIKQAMTEHGLVPEEWGGDVICVPTSAKTKEGIDHLLEMVLLQADMLDLKASPVARPRGTVIESKLDKGRGPVATVLVQDGTLKTGGHVVCGIYEGKVRAMFDYEGRQISEAGPSVPVEILGLSGTPTAGDELAGVADEKAARLVAEQRRLKAREKQMGENVHVSLEGLSAALAVDNSLELNVIVKGDVQGSVEAVCDALTKLSTEKVRLKVIHSAVGGIIESDIMLASASNAIALGFNVRPDSKAKAAADREKVEIRHYRIIYEMIDEVRKAMEGLLAPDLHEVSMGTAEVRDVFRITKVGAIAGCYVTDGKITRSCRARLLRDQVLVFEGGISSLRRFKDDVKEVSSGYECGIGIENYNDIKVGDVIEAYIIEKKAATL
jgi:translation initiation factor IF-2